VVSGCYGGTGGAEVGRRRAPSVERADGHAEDVVSAVLDEVVDTLTECLEFLDNYVDVEDGDYGQPRPNKAMSLSSRIEAVITAVNLEAKR